MIEITVRHIDRFSEAFNIIGRVIAYAKTGVPECRVNIKTSGISTFFDIETRLVIEMVADTAPQQVLDIIKQEAGDKVLVTTTKQMGGEDND